MSVFNFHSQVLADYRDFARSFFTVADDPTRKFSHCAILGCDGWTYIAEGRMKGWLE